MSEVVGHDVLAGVSTLLPAFRARAQEAEDLRRIPDASIKELQELGFFRLLQPKTYGGHEADPVTFYSVVKEIAAACGSTGWVSSIIGVHSWHLALFPKQAQEDVWGENPDTRISSSYAPMGKGVITEGGYRLTGKWSWSSGCDHATWVMVGGPVLNGDGKPVDFCTFLVPRPDYTVNDVWDVVGLRGTGSNDIVINDVFVPAHRVLSFMDMSSGTAPGLVENTAALYKMPWGTIHPTTISTPIVGMAAGAYAAHVEHQGKRVRAAFAGEKARDDPFAKVRIAEAASDIDAAWLQLAGNVAAEHALLAAGEEVPMSLRLRARRDQVRATGRAIGAVDRLFENSGASALQNGTPIQRFWRDAHAGRVHAANEPERAYVMYGSGEFGLPITDSMV
ncbi:3-hydroxy-9,10-secoandrosta-1,3,5(10)-triene-9,17-dione monooxygenase oxygenase subunit [Rhodococcus sp. X156]|uniref:3-hydroxy-9,10-secoandrosta-1,3,5(10)-triene-9, 17-dione monooxygenase oxygenase subunit n=1 Tax=Rhodococcus sp. X156 TaxID=2499145 RepID=UPI000FD71E4C|nr:3-hydroxy-9,10-secoandrosta-1,3,5(10)-triene-9,17-dione monooxygenase oxygenase subunit [Rhodococcus sp. X156]